MKERLEGRYAWHLYGASSGEGDEAVANPLITNDQVKRVPAVRHLIVRPHDVTGRKTLYGVAGTPYAIEGMDEDEGAAILKDLKRHALQERFIYRHKYRVGDIAIYDTTQTLHSGTPIEPANGRPQHPPAVAHQRPRQAPRLALTPGLSESPIPWQRGLPARARHRRPPELHAGSARAPAAAAGRPSSILSQPAAVPIAAARRPSMWQIANVRSARFRV